MKITILTLGTRGDVQPYAVLGQALKARGHEITFSTAKNFEDLVRSYGLNFHPIEADFRKIVKSDEGKKILKANLFAIRRNLKKVIFPLIETSLTEFYNLAKASDLLIYRPKTLADVFVDKLEIKAIRAAVVPAMAETAEFPNPSISGFKIPEFLNKWTYRFDFLRYTILKKPIEKFLIKHGLNDEITPALNIPCIYGISQSFLERPEDWKENQHLTGFWFGQSTEELPAQIQDFINAGPAPIAITFGSMETDPKLEEYVIRAAAELGQRFIVITNWGNWDLEKFAENKRIMAVRSVAYDKLFPKVQAVIHHGGIGTTAECLRAGKPMFISPVLYPLGDQSFWGDQSVKKGVGVKPVPLSKLSYEQFADAIQQLVNIKSLHVNAQIIGKQLSKEDGLKNVTDFIDQLLGVTALQSA